MSQKVTYSKFFAPPEFLQMPAVAIEILPEGIYFLSLRQAHNGLLPKDFGFVPLAHGDVVQAGVVNREAVIKALISIQKKTKAIFARFSLPEEQTYIFKTHLPNLKPEEIHDILDFKLEENIPLTSKEAVFDYDIVRGQKRGSGLDLVVSAAPLKMVEDLQVLFQSAGFTATLFSPESNNVAKAVVRVGNEQVLVVINIKESSIVMSLVVFGIVYQTSSINFGSSIFIEALAKYYNVSPTELNQAQKDKLYSDGPESLEIFSQIINTVSAIKDEINKFISYCNEREDIITKVDRVIICGQSALIIGLNKYLADNLGLPVDVANIWSNNFDLNKYMPELSQRESQDYAVVNGLSLF